jgi:hypothetical protein
MMLLHSYWVVIKERQILLQPVLAGVLYQKVTGFHPSLFNTEVLQNQRNNYLGFWKWQFCWEDTPSAMCGLHLFKYGDWTIL